MTCIIATHVDTAYKCYSVFNVLPYTPFVGRWIDPINSDLFIPRQSPGSQSSGDEGTRTPDLLLAKEALSRLSYIPSLNWKWAFQDSDLRPRPYQRRALTN